MSPGIRDSRLNTAECVIEGHKINMMAAKRGVAIKLILVFAFLFSFLIGPYIAYFILTLLHDHGFQSSSLRQPNSSTENRGGQPRRGDEGSREETLPLLQHGAEAETSSGQESRQESPLVSSIVCVSFLSFCAEITILVFVFKFSISENAPIEVSIFPGILILESISLTCFSKCFTKNNSPNRSRIDTCKHDVKVFIVTFSSILLSYHLSWLVVGIMINPLWGTTVLLLACLFVVMGTFLLYQIFDRDNDQGKKDCFLLIVMCVALFFGGCSLFVLVILAGQSFSGRETADDLVKTVLLYVIGGFISLFSLRGDKKNKTKPEKKKEKKNKTKPEKKKKKRTKRKKPNISNREDTPVV